MVNNYTYDYIRKYIICNFPYWLIQKYLIPLNFTIEIEVIPNSLKDPIKTIITFFEMNNKYYNIYNINNYNELYRSSDSEYVGKNKYEVNSTELNIIGFPFSVIQHKNMSPYYFNINLSTFKYIDADDYRKNFTATIMYIQFSQFRFLTLHFATISKLIKIINIDNDDKTKTKTKREILYYSDREELLLFVNGYVPKKNQAHFKKQRVLCDPYWCRSVSEYLTYDCFIIDYKGEDNYSSCFI
jgi:hypothetical protein